MELGLIGLKITINNGRTVYNYYKKMKRIIFFWALVCVLQACNSNSGNSGRYAGQGEMEWNIFRGDESLSGYTDIRLPESPVLLWTYKSEKRTDSSPIIHKGITYWSDSRGRILGVDMDGKLIFDYDLQTAVNATPMIFESTLYVGRIDGVMTAISLEKKDTLWTYETMGQVSASPNRVNFKGHRAIVFGSYDNFLYCVDAKTGDVINSFESGYYLNGAVALHKQHAIFGGCDAWLRIINCETGVSTDSLLLEAYIPASPAIMGDYCYVGDYSGNIYELQLDKGIIINQKKIMESSGENGSFNSVPAVASKAVYFLSDDRHLYSIDRKEGTVTWKYMLKGNPGESSPVVCKDKVLVCTRTGIISIIDINNGELVWEYDTGEQITGSPAVVKGRFMILSAKGALFCFGKIQ